MTQYSKLVLPVVICCAQHPALHKPASRSAQGKPMVDQASIPHQQGSTALHRTLQDSTVLGLGSSVLAVAATRQALGTMTLPWDASSQRQTLLQEAAQVNCS